ncbi:multiprotein bridging factor aMBF1 [Halorhabdus amylolytica]|uniref:multiprotein bridging factor aMBF1 n=1 Tax=Halorhabdus amylolytica TaxID=2559573 RepID=UPI0010AABB37|nr:multiprotein bridging factor aMBF1 [Halorhabdus amylolytica]
MVQCEMCGTETQSPNTIKVEGAELDVCDECTDFGTEVKTQDASSTSTKYSTSSSSNDSSSGGSTTASSGSSGGGGGGSRRDMFDEMDELAQDFDQRIRSARESAGLSQSELADELNEKASLIRKLEHGDHLPSDEVQRKLERELSIDLTEGAGEGDTDWEGGSDVGEYTLGDVVERKDS